MLFYLLYSIVKMDKLLLKFRFMRLLVTLLALFSSGCASMYFKTLDEKPTIEPLQLSDWPWQEYWTGIIFNGNKIGFSHQKFVPEKPYFRISSEAALRLHFLMLDKEFAVISHDWVDANLQLKRFEYTYKIDKSHRFIKGDLHNNQLTLEVSAQAHMNKKVLQFEGELVPMNAIYLYPVLHGLEVGKTYHYQVFDGESLAIHPVEQKIIAYQSSKLFDERAFKMKTEVLGLTTTTWLDTSGLPQIELSLNGALISALEPEDYAKEYLTQAALAKSDYLITFSLIPVSKEIENPRSLKSMRVRISGVPETFKFINTSMQQCHKNNNIWECHIQSDEKAPDTVTTNTASITTHDLSPSFTVNSNVDEIINLAQDITSSTTDPNIQVQYILEWLNENIEKEAIDSFNSLDVLAQKKAECQGHSFLFAALARSLDIPTRLLNGVVYSEEYKAFLYHTWVESYLDNHWQAIDPTFGQRYADATHVALIEGEELAHLTALLPLIGKLEITLDLRGKLK